MPLNMGDRKRQQTPLLSILVVPVIKSPQHDRVEGSPKPSNILGPKQDGPFSQRKKNLFTSGGPLPDAISAA